MGKCSILANNINFTKDAMLIIDTDIEKKLLAPLIKPIEVEDDVVKHDGINLIKDVKPSSPRVVS